MKLEIGESLCYSYLRHVKHCWLVQTNWKPSEHWAARKSDAELEAMFLDMEAKVRRRRQGIQADQQRRPAHQARRNRRRRHRPTRRRSRARRRLPRKRIELHGRRRRHRSQETSALLHAPTRLCSIRADRAEISHILRFPKSKSRRSNAARRHLRRAAKRSTPKPNGVS